MVRQFNKFSNTVLRRIFFLKTMKSMTRRYQFIFFKSSNIPATFVKSTLRVYKGNCFKNFIVQKYMMSLIIGSLVFTRKPHTFISKKKKKANSIRR